MQKYSVDFFDQEGREKFSWGILIIFLSVKDRLICLSSIFFCFVFHTRSFTKMHSTETLVLQGGV